MKYHNILFFALLLVTFQDVCLYTMSYRYHLSPSWYPKKKQDLFQDLQERKKIADASCDIDLLDSQVRAIVVPHAGYEYSGNVAMNAYKFIKPGTFQRVVILAPSHYASFNGVALPGKQYGMFQSPLGRISLDRKMIHELDQSSDLFSFYHEAHEVEHSIEVQIPFIQTCCGRDVQIVPLLVGSLRYGQLGEVANRLQTYLQDKKTLLVVSSDLTHYGERFNYTPFTENITESIYNLDSLMVEQIQNCSLSGFMDVLNSTKATVCGKGPLMLFLKLLENKLFEGINSYVVGYETSAKSERNPEHSVSYVSLVFSQERKKNIDLTGYEQKFLLKLAYNCLQHVVNKKTIDTVSLPGITTKSLRSHSGAFVSFYNIANVVQKKLRGCVGRTVSDEPLYKTVISMVKSAALNDSRFSPITKKELDSILVDISVLTLLQDVDSYKDITLGKDGILLHYQNKSALFLPDIPLEKKWNIEQTLGALSLKAGLSRDDWQSSDAAFQIFQTNQFSKLYDDANHRIG